MACAMSNKNRPDLQWEDTGLCVHAAQGAESNYLGLERNNRDDKLYYSFLESVSSELERIEDFIQNKDHCWPV